MRVVMAAVVGVLAVGPAMAQNLNDVGRALGEQLIPRQQQQQQPNRDVNAYEQGRRDQEEQNRRDRERRPDERRRDDRYREDDRRRGDDDRRRPEYDRERSERERAGRY